MSEEKQKQDKREGKIDRKEALRKAGKYAAFTASGMIYLLSSNKVLASSTEPEPPGGGW